MSDIDQTLLSNSNNNHEDEIFTIRKQMRSQEAEFKKNKAVLEQRIEILELQNRELKEREESLKKMNNSIVGAFQDLNKENDPSSSKMIRELEAAKQTITKEYSEYKIRTQEMLRSLDKENKEVKEKLHEIESKYNQSTLFYEKNDGALQEKIQNLENERVHMNQILKFNEEELKSFKEKELNQNELQAKITELRFLLDKQSGEHRKEVERIHNEYNEAIKNIKMISASEKTSLESQVHKLLDSKKLDGSLFEDIKKNYASEISRLKKERDSSFQRNESLEQQMAEMSENMKIIEEKAAHEKSEHDKETKELRRMKLKMMDIEGLLRKYEQDEKNLKQMITEKDYKIEEVSTEFKKKLGNEKRRYEQVQEVAKKHREEAEKKIAVLTEENLKKEEMIKKLKSQAKNKDSKYGRKTDNTDANKTNTSLVNISLIGQSLSTSKYNPARGIIQEVKSTRYQNGPRSLLQTKNSESKISYEDVQKELGKSSYREDFEFTKEEDDTKDLTNQNILLEISSPRTVYSASTYRSVSSSKKEPEFLIASSNLGSNLSKAKTPSNTKGPEKPVLNINLWNDGLNSIEMNQSRNEEENKNVPKRKSNLNRTATSENRLLSSTSLELRKKNVSICGNDLSLFKDKTGLGSDFGRISSQSESNKNLLHFKSITNALDLTNSLNLHSQKSEGMKMHQSRADFKDPLHEISNDTSQDKIKERGNRHRGGVDYKKENIDYEKEKLKFERDRLAMELQQTKMEWAISEENKEESELALKSEIKFLVNKLVQVKNPNGGVTNSSSHGNLAQLSKGALSKSMMDYQSSIIHHPGEHLNLSQINHQPNPSPSFGSNNNNNYDKTLKIISNNLGENKLNESLEKGKVKKMAKVFSEQNVTPLREKCLNSVDFSTLKYSPNRLEMSKKENSLMMSTMNLNSNPKKQSQYLKR